MTDNETPDKAKKRKEPMSAERRTARKLKRTKHLTGASDAKKNAAMSVALDQFKVGKRKYSWLGKVWNFRIFDFSNRHATRGSRQTLARSQPHDTSLNKATKGFNGNMENVLT
jgi:hypothetical protein